MGPKIVSIAASAKTMNSIITLNYLNYHFSPNYVKHTY